MQTVVVSAHLDGKPITTFAVSELEADKVIQEMHEHPDLEGVDLEKVTLKVCRSYEGLIING